MTVKRSVVLGIAAAAAGTALILPRALAIPGEAEPRKNEEVVDPGDPVMRCEGEMAKSGDYTCEVYYTEVESSREINLPSKKVTDEVAGCQPGNQPTVSKRVTYSKSASVNISASLKFDLKILAGGAGVFNRLKEVGPGLQVGFGLSWSTTFGESENYAIPADYGKVSWGVFTQKAVEATVNQTVALRDIHIGRVDNRLYTAYGIKVVTPIENETTKFPSGTLAKERRDFKSVEEFEELCPNGVLPEYLGGDPNPGEASPDPDPGDSDAAPCESFLKVVAAGLDAGSISSDVGTDLKNKCKSIETSIRNEDDPASLVTELRKSIQQAESDGHITREYADKLEAAVKAMPFPS